MKCQVCGGEMSHVTTDLPFKIGAKTIVILKELPVLQCESCAEFLIEDQIMERVDAILNKSDAAAELEIVRYAA